MAVLTKGKINIGAIDSAWGSSGKGKFNAYLALKEEVDYAVSSNSAQASHVVCFNNREASFTRFKSGLCEYKFNHLPVSVISPSVKDVFLTGSCVINLPKLLEEIEVVGMTPDILHIHPNAVVIQDEDVEIERKNLAGIASTMSGIAPAMGRKIMRKDNLSLASSIPELKSFIDNDFYYRLVGLARNNKKTGVMETAQGFGLSIDHGMYRDKSGGMKPYYPFTTSRNVDPLSFAGSAGIPFSTIGRIMMNVRTFPIRVGDSSTGNGVDARAGVKLGSSGAYWFDQDELTWDEVSKIAGFKIEEKTSLTKRIRRVFTVSKSQINFESSIIDPTDVFINFVNYLDPNIAGVSGLFDFEDIYNMFPKVGSFILEINDILRKSCGARVRLLGTGKFNHEIIEIDYF